MTMGIKRRYFLKGLDAAIGAAVATKLHLGDEYDITGELGDIYNISPTDTPFASNNELIRGEICEWKTDVLMPVERVNKVDIYPSEYDTFDIPDDVIAEFYGGEP